MRLNIPAHARLVELLPAVRLNIAAHARLVELLPAVRLNIAAHARLVEFLPAVSAASCSRLRAKSFPCLNIASHVGGQLTAQGDKLLWSKVSGGGHVTSGDRLLRDRPSP